jgi:hypothetical protein
MTDSVDEMGHQATSTNSWVRVFALPRIKKALFKKNGKVTTMEVNLIRDAYWDLHKSKNDSEVVDKDDDVKSQAFTERSMRSRKKSMRKDSPTERS